MSYIAKPAVSLVVESKVLNKLPLDTMLSYFHPPSIIENNFYKIQFNVILSYLLGLPSEHFLRGLPTKIMYLFLNRQ